MSPILLKPCLLVGTRGNHRESQKLGAGRAQRVGSLHHFFVCVLPLGKALSQFLYCELKANPVSGMGCFEAPVTQNRRKPLQRTGNHWLSCFSSSSALKIELCCVLCSSRRPGILCGSTSWFSSFCLHALLLKQELPEEEEKIKPDKMNESYWLLMLWSQKRWNQSL